MTTIGGQLDELLDDLQHYDLADVAAKLEHEVRSLMDRLGDEEASPPEPEDGDVEMTVDQGLRPTHATVAAKPKAKARPARTRHDDDKLKSKDQVAADLHPISHRDLEDIGGSIEVKAPELGDTLDVDFFSTKRRQLIARVFARTSPDYALRKRGTVIERTTPAKEGEE